MINRRLYENSQKGKSNVKFVNKDLEKIKFKKSDLITSLYTIQFLQPKYRQNLFKKIYNSLNWGGHLFILRK